MTKEKGIPQIRFSGFTDTWEQREVSNVAMISTGGTPSTAINEYWNPKQVPWLSSGEVHKKYITYTDDKISNEGLNHSSARMIKQNSVLIALAGQGKTRGTVAINRISLSTNQSIAAMTFAPDICPEFVFSNLESRYDELRKVSSGDGTRGGLNKQLVSEIQIPYTSLNEQRKIGQFFTHLDRLITLHQRKYDKLTKVKKAMLEKMFPKNGSLYPEIRFKGFTDAWEQRKFSELTEIRSASRVHKEEWQSSGVPFYRSSDVMAALNGTENEKAFISEELYEKLSAVSGKLEKGDILVTGGGSVGKPYIVPNNEPLYTKDADLLWVKNNEKLVPYFIYTFFFSPAFSDYLNSVSHVGTIAHYTITQLEETPITLPCVSEQQKIGDYFRNIDSLITLHQRKLEKLKNIKKACLEKMFV